MSWIYRVPHHRFSLPLLVALVAALAGSAPARAQGDFATSQWEPKLDKIEQHLLAGDYRAAEKASKKLVERMLLHYAAYENPAETMARAVTWLAVAEAGLDNRHAALWHWSAAQSLDRRVQRMDLSRFGGAGKLLLEFPLRRPGSIPSYVELRPPAPEGGEAIEADGPAYRPAVPKEPINYNVRRSCSHLGYSKERLPQALSVEIVVDTEGRPHAPVLLTPSRFPGFAFAALEGLREAKMEPAWESGLRTASLETFRVEFPFSW